MRSLILTILSCVLLFSQGFSAFCPSLTCGWDFYAGVIGLHRNRPHGQAIIVDAVTLNEVLDADEFNFGITPGYDLRARKQFASFFLDARYFHMREWSDTFNDLSLPANAFVATRPFLPFLGLLPGNRFSYTSQLWNAEVNAGFPVACTRFSAFFGFRKGKIDDKLELFSNANIGQVTSFDYQFTTHNDLLGPQAGIRMDGVPLFWRCSLEGFVKGWFYKDSARNQFIGAENGVVLESFGANKNLGGIAFDGSFGLKTCIFKRFALHVNYEALYFNRVALGSDQMPNINFILETSFISNRHLFYQGVLAGISLKW